RRRGQCGEGLAHPRRDLHAGGTGRARGHHHAAGRGSRAAHSAGLTVMLQVLHRFGSPPWFYDFSRRWAPWIGVLAALLIGGGLVGGLVLAPPDYQQGEAFRIIYVHVPSAWMSLFVYMM